MKRYFACLAVTVLTVSWLCGTSQAALVPLSELVAGGTLQSGDKIFSNFTYRQTGDMPTADQVNVEDIVGANGDFGVRFSGGFLDQAGGSSSDGLVTFDVSVPMGSTQVIAGARMQANPAVFDNATGLATVTETFLPDIADDKLVVFDFGAGDDKLADEITFSQTYSTLSVQKDIILHTTSAEGAVTLSFIDQTFHQIPEPSSLVLLLGSLLGAVVLHRRR